MAKDISYGDNVYKNVSGVCVGSDTSKVFYDTDISASLAATAADIRKSKQAVVNGVKILGTHEEESANLGNKTIYATAESVTYKASDDGYDGYKTVAFVPQGTASMNIQDTKSVEISSNSSTILPDTGYDAMKKVSYSVSAGVDSNIKAGNIRDGVRILGVLGTYTGGVPDVDPCFWITRYETAYRIYIRLNGYMDESRLRTYTGSRWVSSTSKWTSTFSGTTKWDSDLKCQYIEITSTTYQTSRWRFFIDQTASESDGSVTDSWIIDTGVAANNYTTSGGYSYSGGYWYGGELTDEYDSTSNTTRMHVFTLSTSLISVDPYFGSTSSGSSDAIEGSFTPTSADNVSGGRITVSTNGYPRVVSVWQENQSTDTEIDNNAPLLQFACAIDDVITGDSIAYGFNRRKGTNSTSGAYQKINAAYYDTVGFFSDSYAAEDATSALRCVNATSTGVVFKTYGDYAYRVGKKYFYRIIM